MASEHTAKAFDSDLQELTRLVAEMGGLVERMIVESVDALVRRDAALGQRVVAADAEVDNLQRVIDLVQSQVKAVLDAYAAHDLPSAMAVWKGDEEVDAICTSLFRELLTYMMEDPRNISFCIHLMFCAKNIERIGDHATNIAETVFYMIEGQQILDKRPKGNMTTFATTVPGN